MFVWVLFTVYIERESEREIELVGWPGRSDTQTGSGPDGNSILSGHLDGSIWRFSFETETVSRPVHMKLAQV